MYQKKTTKEPVSPTGQARKTQLKIGGEKEKGKEKETQPRYVHSRKLVSGFSVLHPLSLSRKTTHPLHPLITQRKPTTLVVDVKVNFPPSQY